ncbi:hypothetical protein EDD86DRAFT_203094 [Gorgonomyces haynaldii]|nr:hypothetical protein EDD86DRAFT_203094 [Gorgonomyces haynaldii]
MSFLPMATRAFSRDTVLPPIGKERDEEFTQPDDDFSYSSKLTNIEAQRIMAVIQEIQKKVHMMNMLNDAAEKRTNSILSAETSALVREHLQLESRFKQATEQKTETAELVKQLKQSTRTLTRHFLQNPSALSKLKYLKSTQTPVIAYFEHRLQECKTLIFEKLKTTVEEEVAKQEHLAMIIAKEQKTTSEVNALKEELEKAKKERMGEINKKNEIIRKLKDELRDIKHQAEDATKKLENRSKVKEEAELELFRQKETDLSTEIDQLKKKLEETVLFNREEEANARKKKFKIESEVENWIHKYDQDMEEKQAEIDDLTVIYNEEKSHLDELQSRFQDLQKEYDAVLEERKKAEQIKKEKQMLIEKRNQAATKIQALWRGYKTRKDLKKAKNDKGKKDKKKKK